MLEGSYISNWWRTLPINGIYFSYSCFIIRSASVHSHVGSKNLGDFCQKSSFEFLRKYQGPGFIFLVRPSLLPWMISKSWIHWNPKNAQRLSQKWLTPKVDHHLSWWYRYGPFQQYTTQKKPKAWHLNMEISKGSPLSFHRFYLSFQKCRLLKILRQIGAVLARDLLAVSSHSTTCPLQLSLENFGIFPYSRCMASLSVCHFWFPRSFWMSLMVSNFWLHKIGYYVTFRNVVFEHEFCAQPVLKHHEISGILRLLEKPLLLFPCTVEWKSWAKHQKSVAQWVLQSIK